MNARGSRHQPAASTARAHREAHEKQSLAPRRAGVLALQQSAGNRAVDSLLRANAPAVRDGKPLEPNVRAEMESRFEHDFSDVRVHTDALASDSADALRAKAYAVGRDVVFGDHRYAPHSHEGKHLLAHELAHVVQQRRGGPAPDPHGNAGLEAGASSAAAKVAQGHAAGAVAGTCGVGIARDEDPSKKDDRLDRLYSAFRQSRFVPQNAKDAITWANEEVKKRVDAVDPSGALREAVKKGAASAIGNERLDAAHQALETGPASSTAASPTTTEPPADPEATSKAAAAAVKQERLDSLRKRIAEIDAELTGPGSFVMAQDYRDTLEINRARLSHELAGLQPATPEQAEAILDREGVERRKRRDYDNFINLPKGLQDETLKSGVLPPEKPAGHWVGTLPSPDFQRQVEAIMRKADDEHISIESAARKIQQQRPTPSPDGWSTDPTKLRHEMNRQMMAIGGRPVQDPARESSDWEKRELETSVDGKRNPRQWHTIYNPDSGDIVGYERESNGYYERRNPKGELTHVREAPMTEDDTLLTRPDRELTPFERQHVFIEKDGRSNPESLRPIYDRQTGQIVGYVHKSIGLTTTYTPQGVQVQQFELGVEPSAIQPDDLIGIAGLARAIGKKLVMKSGKWFLVKAGDEIAEQGGKRLLAGTGEEVIEKVGKSELQQVGREGADELGELELKKSAQAGEVSLDLGEGAVGVAKAESLPLATSELDFHPMPAEVGEAAYKARMERSVENAMRANRRNTIGAGGEAAAQGRSVAASEDLNAIQRNFPQLDLVTRDGMESVKVFGAGKPLDATVTKRYLKEVQALRTAVEPGVPTKLGKAADLLSANRQTFQANGTWPRGLPKDASSEEIAKFINRQGRVTIPHDHFEAVRAALAADAKVNPGLYGLTPGPGLDKGIERLVERVQSMGLTTGEIMAINRKVLAGP